MTFDFSWGAILIGLIIFGLRVCDVSMDTLRVLFVVRGRKLLAWILGFLQSAIFVVAISSVLTNAKSFVLILGYAAGFATGNVVGMLIEERLAIGHIKLTIISPARGKSIIQVLRDKGYAVTEIVAQGKDGTVTMMNCYVRRKEVDDVEKIALKTDPKSFITAEDIRPVRRGFWRA
jgi:uncharacterized protein YebE (UPF0316 family)